MTVIALYHVVHKLAIPDAFLGRGELPDRGEGLSSFVQMTVSLFVVDCHEGETAVAVSWVHGG